MADRGVMSPGYCTFPRPPSSTNARLSSVAEHTERQQVLDRDANHAGHFYTLRPAKMGGVGGRLNPVVGSFRKVPTTEDLAESNRSLLYQQNMSTFENFCERRNSEQRLQPHRAGGEEEVEEDESAELAGPDSLGNFCTLRKVRRSRSGSDSVTSAQQSDASRRPLGGAYCTLKKKKLQLNRKFVESFLEDPNAKVVDYLSELDAYLDEMDDELCGDVDDGDSACEDHCLEQNLPALDSKCESAREEEEQAGESLQYYQTEVRGEVSEECAMTANDVYQEDRIKFGDIKHFCTLPKQKRTQFLDAFKRGASMRRSVASQPKATDEPVTIRDEKIVCEKSSESGDTSNEEHQLTIAESDRIVAALEAKLAVRKLKSGRAPVAPLPFSHFKAFCLDWVRKCETATEKVRFETRATERQIADHRALIDQKRQSVGNDALRVHLESFTIERLVGERDLRAAQHTDYELRRLGAEVKREMLMEKLVLYETTQHHGRLRDNVNRWSSRLAELQAKIERTDREVELLERQNDELRAKLCQYRVPSVQEMANRVEKLRQLQARLYRRVKRGILDGSIAVPVGKVEE
uniref:Uncharacterized protein n=1 Tax=Anopheles stephensi TaxID=30069 RepID=A0A182Y1S7_ANOST